MEQEEDIVELGDEMREGLLRLGEALGHLLEMRHVGQLIPGVGSVQFGIQLFEIRLADFIANGFDLLISQQSFFTLHPMLHLRSLLPIAVVFLQHLAKQVAGLGFEALILSYFAKITACVLGGQDKNILVAFECVV